MSSDPVLKAAGALLTDTQERSTLRATGSVKCLPVAVRGSHLTIRADWTGTPTGTFTIEYTMNGSTWHTWTAATFASHPAGSATGATYEFYDCPGVAFRLAYAATSGTGTLTAYASQADAVGTGAAFTGTQNTAVAPVSSATNAWSVAMSTALANKLIVKASAGNLRAVSGRLDSTLGSGTYYVHLWNLTDIPANATAVTTGNSLMAPQKIIHVTGADSRFVFDFPDSIRGSVGITLGLSTTEFTQTAGSAHLSATAEYK